jgi:hypothetical protein
MAPRGIAIAHCQLRATRRRCCWRNRAKGEALAVFAWGASVWIGLRTVSIDGGLILIIAAVGITTASLVKDFAYLAVSGAGALRLDAGLEILLGRS